MFRFWGKYKESKVHLLIYHSLDVASVAHTWLNNSPVLIKKFQQLFNVLSEEDIINFISWITSIHDIGKLSYGFQKKVLEAVNQLKTPLKPVLYHKPFDHGAFGAFWLNQSLKKNQLTIFPHPLEEKETLFWESLFMASCAHHGRFYSPSDYGRTVKKDYLKELDADLDGIRLDFINEITELFPIPKIKIMQSPTLARSAFLAGFISVCDWLGSNTNYFEYVSDKVDLQKYFNDSCSKAKKVLKDSGLLDSVKNTALNEVNKVFQLDFRPIQAEMNRLTNPSGLVIVEAPTGEGKTEAAYLWLYDLLSKGAIQGAYFALPTRATANALYDRIKDNFLKRLVPDGQITLELAHSSSWIKDSYMETFKSSSNSFNDPTNPEASVVSSEWMRSSKRTLLSSFGIGTVDQAMTASLKIKHFFVKFFGLAKGAVVFDEIHAYDSYMDTIINRLLEWLGALNVPVILLSATLPLSKKKEFIKSYSGQSVQLSSEEYPLITTCLNDVQEIGGMDAAINRVISVDYKEAEDLEGIKNLVLGKIQNGGCLCVITNTVKRCQELYSYLNEDTDILAF
ncbi:MAG TPA: CRISPR-associated helicase Cas3', partial [Spirochaetes bacterium]|nr:CRISPR-associated helicase Cas3' [Spirochaetota bacterium]